MKTVFFKFISLLICIGLATSCANEALGGVINDSDGDGIINSVDNCPETANPNQEDLDEDGIGDVCDPTDDTDTDADGIIDAEDNCPEIANPNQEDSDENGVGDACETVDQTDTDGDGILDQDDAYPEDPEVAFEFFTPSKYGKGTIAFEDLWPSKGDYDFNDAALSYQAIAFLNAENLAVGLNFVCNIKANGAGYTNGIGFEIEGLTPAQIESVTGPVLTQNFINVNANGTEANQDNAVIILADDVDNILTETTISIRFTQPISSADLGVAPFNPFIIVNKVREKEIHLPYKNITSLGVQSLDFIGVNKDSDGNFISDNGFPWQ